MTETEKTALKNDREELEKGINPAHVHITELTPMDGCSVFLQVDVVGITTWVCSTDNPTPHRSNSIRFFLTASSPYPSGRIHVFYGDKEWPAHVNVHLNNCHTQCLDVQDRYASLYRAIRKTLRAIVFDPAVVRFDSKANSQYLEFMTSHANQFPSFNPAKLFRCSARMPTVHK